MKMCLLEKKIFTSPRNNLMYKYVFLMEFVSLCVYNENKYKICMYCKKY